MSLHIFQNGYFSKHLRTATLGSNLFIIEGKTTSFAIIFGTAISLI